MCPGRAGEPRIGFEISLHVVEVFRAADDRQCTQRFVDLLVVGLNDAEEIAAADAVTRFHARLT